MRTAVMAWLGALLALSACSNDPGSNSNQTAGPATVGAPTNPNLGAAGAGGLVAQQPTATTNPTATAPAANPASSPAVQQPAAAAPAGGMGTSPTQDPGTGAMAPADSTDMTAGDMQMAPADNSHQLALDECGLDTGWDGDDVCIKPPPADKGFQLHIGPSDYNNPDPRYVMEPGTEVTEDWPDVSGNDQDVYYYWRQYRMRPGSHHLIITAGSLIGGHRLGGTSNPVKDNPEAGIIAPENQGVGMPLAAHTSLSSSLHYFNFTDKPIIKEVWVNFWYRDPADVTEASNEVFSMLTMGISPGQHVVKHGACTVNSPGRLLTVYGHVHAHNKRFSVWRTRGTDKMLIHEAYNWEEPNISEFSSIVQNPPLDPADKVDGGYSGIVDLQPGDVLEFDCDIVNDTANVFVGQNEAENDEMCIMIGDSVGTTVPGFCTETDLPPTD